MSLITEKDELYWVAKFPNYPGWVGLGDTEGEAIISLFKVISQWCNVFVHYNGVEKLPEAFREHER